MSKPKRSDRMREGSMPRRVAPWPRMRGAGLLRPRRISWLATPMNFAPISLARWLLRISALILSVYAVAFLVHPPLLGVLVGFDHHSPNTLVEVSAFYGGLELGLALWMVWCSVSDDRLRTGLMLLFFVFLSAGLARLLGIARFGFEDPSQPTVTMLEIGWSIGAILLAARLERGGGGA